MATYLTLLGFGLIAAAYAGLEHFYMIYYNKNQEVKCLAYGCFCRYAGNTEPAVVVDRCCQTYECCYTAIIEKRVCNTTRQGSTVAYNYTKSNGSIICNADPNSCPGLVCNCDKELIRCLRAHNDAYKLLRSFFDQLGICPQKDANCSYAPDANPDAAPAPDPNPASST